LINILPNYSSNGSLLKETFLTFLDEFEEDLDKDAVLGSFQRVVGPVIRGPAVCGEEKNE